MSRLLRCTLHPLSTRRNIVVILVHASGSTLCPGLRVLARVNVLGLKVFHHGVGRSVGLLHTRRQNLIQEVKVLQLVLLGELNIELNVEVTVVMVTERRHTLALDHLDGAWRFLLALYFSSHTASRELTRSDNLARSDVHVQPPVVKVLNGEAASAKSRKKINLNLVEKVVLLALEPGVRLGLNFEDNISGHDTRNLVTLPAELNLVAVPDTLVDVDVEHLALNNGLLTTALLAAVLVTDHLSLTVTVWANGLEALDHGTHLAHHGLHTGTIAAGTRLDGAFLTTAALAARANDGLLQRQLRDLAAVDVLQVDLVNVVDGTGLLRASVPHTTAEHAAKRTTAAAEELREEILSAHSTTGATALETFFTELIIDGALVRIRQNLVGVGQFLEFIGGFGVVCVLVCSQRSGQYSKTKPVLNLDSTYQGGT